ncbi:hypothetical protein EMCG_00136 [[Emmonsia] crescens]|uniref:Protein kinase domain-containing protein n=1 Tax=[Emmonsia] crescens TaxID=73230 RepID=A0A0G2IZI1_9EURO|nr:hypothetical protein EMCG_00136 [Emmonsia crescens UAMH 3008]
MLSQHFRARWIRSLIDTFYHIYSCKILHQDIKLSNILVDNGCLKVIDFANGAIFPLDTDMEAIFANNHLARVDILCLACVLYSIATWQIFRYDHFKKDRWPVPEELPPTSNDLCEDTIKTCWEDKYGTIASLYEDMTDWLLEI